MRLRARLALTLAALVIPLAALLVWGQDRLEWAARRNVLSGAVLSRMQSGGRERCESDAAHWPGRASPSRETSPPQASKEASAKAPEPSAEAPQPSDTAPESGRQASESRRRASESSRRTPEAHAEAPRSEHADAPESSARARSHTRAPKTRPRRGRRPERKERAKETHPGHGHVEATHAQRWRYYAYDASFVSANPDAPKFPPALRQALDDGEDIAYRRVDRRRSERATPSSPGNPAALDASLDDSGFEDIAVRMPWADGPCAVVWLRRPALPEQSLLAAAWPAGLVSLAAILIVVIAAGPLVARIRRLTRDVADGEVGLDTGGRDEIAELGRAFAANQERIGAQLQALEAREAMLTGYILDTTHDVMLPLTVLQGHLSRLGTMFEQRAEHGEERRLVSGALEEAHYLGSLLRNLNASARLRGGVRQLQMHEVALGPLVERVVARHRPIARERGVALDFAVPEAPVRARADVTLLEQAASNLVQNAVRYNARGGHVAVTLEGPIRGRFALVVADDGPGIAADERARLMSRGVRGEAARGRHPGGMGLGLGIVRGVAERHGIDFSLEPREGGGLVATLSGPCLPPDAGPERDDDDVNAA